MFRFLSSFWPLELFAVISRSGVRFHVDKLNLIYARM